MTSPTPEALAHPSVLRLKRVAMALGELAAEVVFIGGAVSPLLQEDPPFDQARVTKDVDGIIATSRYTDIAKIGKKLEQKGFQHSTAARHIHKWTSPEGDELDLVPAGQHIGASGQAWDEYAADDNVQADLGDGVIVRHASSAAFLALKWAAFKDRGEQDPGRSHDLEDIAAVVVSRPGIVDEVRMAPENVRKFIVERTQLFLRDDRAEDYLAGCFNHAQDPAYTFNRAVTRLREIANR